MTTREVLVEARRILTPDGAWTQRKLARDRQGRGAVYHGRAAVCWCLEGALARAAFTDCGDRDWSAALDACDSALPGSGRGRLIVWNDAPGRTQAEVLGLLDRAIEREGEA